MFINGGNQVECHHDELAVQHVFLGHNVPIYAIFGRILELERLYHKRLSSFACLSVILQWKNFNNLLKYSCQFQYHLNHLNLF